MVGMSKEQKTEHKIVWTIDVAKVIQMLIILFTLIYGLYNGFDKLDNFIELKAEELEIERLSIQERDFDVQKEVRVYCERSEPLYEPPSVMEPRSPKE